MINLYNDVSRDDEERESIELEDPIRFEVESTG